LVQLYETTLAEFQNEPSAAQALLSAAGIKASDEQESGQLAAWTIVGNVLLNLDETLMRN
jgi:hypothetical protein